MTISLRIKELMGDMTIAAFAELIEEEKIQRLKDVLRGQQKCPEDMLVRIVKATGCDANWLLLGIGAAPAITPRQRALLDSYEHSDEAGKKIIEGTALLAAKQKTSRSA
jgi:hypothetical protein